MPINIQDFLRDHTNAKFGEDDQGQYIVVGNGGKLHTSSERYQDAIRPYEADYERLSSGKPSLGEGYFGSDPFTGYQTTGGVGQYDPITIDGKRYVRAGYDYNEIRNRHPDYAKIMDEEGIRPEHFRPSTEYGPLVLEEAAAAMAPRFGAEVGKKGEALDAFLTRMPMIAGMAISGAALGGSLGALDAAGAEIANPGILNQLGFSNPLANVPNVPTGPGGSAGTVETPWGVNRSTSEIDQFMNGLQDVTRQSPRGLDAAIAGGGGSGVSLGTIATGLGGAGSLAGLAGAGGGGDDSDNPPLATHSDELPDIGTNEEDDNLPDDDLPGRPTVPGDLGGTDEEGPGTNEEDGGGVGDEAVGELLGRIPGLAASGLSASDISSLLRAGIPLASILASVASGVLGSNAASRAADAQAQSAQAAIAEQRRQYDLTRADNAPFLATGTAGNARLKALLGLDPTYTGADSGSLTRKFTDADMQADPVYQSGLKFGLDEGTKGVNARAIGAGNYDSGATLKALTRYGNDYGSTKGQDAFNRFQTENTGVYNRLAGVSGAGQTAVNTVATAGTNMANNVSNELTGAGNARAAGIVGGAQAWGSAAQGINNAFNTYQSNQVLERLLAGRGY